jgi:hypothetical protein
VKNPSPAAPQAMQIRHRGNGVMSKDPLLHETWIACTVCGNWYHSSCAELDGVLKDDGKLFCSVCLE